MTISEIKKSALNSLSGKWGNAVLLTLVFNLITLGISFLYLFLERIPLIGFLFYIGMLVFFMTIEFGVIFCFMEIKKNNNVECIDYFKFGFSNFKKIWCVIGNVLKQLWLYMLLYFVLIFVTTFLSIFMIGFSIALKSIPVLIFGCILTFILFAGCITMLVLLTMKEYYYVIAPYIMWDNPDLSAKEIVEKSKILMDGHRGEFFLLNLSFIGWMILALFTLGIGYLWLIPYIQTSLIVFYEDLLNKSDNDNSDKSEDNEETKNIEAPDTVNTEEIVDNNKLDENNIEEVKEEDIKKVDILDDNGNIIG